MINKPLDHSSDDRGLSRNNKSDKFYNIFLLLYLSGASVEHIYPQIGRYTILVSAHNVVAGEPLYKQTEITIIEPIQSKFMGLGSNSQHDGLLNVNITEYPL